MNATINLPFTATLNGPTRISYVADVSGVSCYAAEAKAKKILRDQLAERVTEGIKALENNDQTIIGCVDGTILLVQWKHNSWTYSIVGQGREHSSHVHSNIEGFQSMVEAAEHHAEQSYGGVAWSLRL